MSDTSSMREAGPRARVFAYIRVSSLKQDEHGSSLPAQAQLLTGYIDKYMSYKLGENGYDWDRRFCADVCSSRVGLINRPAGYTMMQEIKPGDHICMVGWDRLFRSLKDAVLHMQEFWDHGISIHDTRTNIDTSLPTGRLTVMQLVMHAEMEQELRQERLRAVRKYKRDRGLPVGSFAPTGWRYTGHGKEKRMLPCELSRKMALQIVELRDVQGLTFREIALWYWNRWNKTRGEERKLYSMISHRPRKSNDIQGSLSVPAIRYLYLGHKTGWPVTGIKRYVAQHGRSGVRNHPIVSDSGDEALNRITAKSADAWRERRQHLIQAASKRKTKHFTPKPSQTMDELERAG